MMRILPPSSSQRGGRCPGTQRLCPHHTGTQRLCPHHTNPNKGDIDHFIGTIPQFKDTNNRKSKKRSASTAINLITKFAKTVSGQVEIIDAMRKNVVEKSSYAASTIASSPLVIGVVDRARELLSGTIGRGAVELWPRQIRDLLQHV
jgi:hypothetical protein